MEENLIDLAFDSASMSIKENWDAIKDTDLVIAQS
jgi:hypothetical protein